MGHGAYEYVLRCPCLYAETLNTGCSDITAAVLELGSLVGALMAGVFADKYTRRQSIFTACGE